MNIQILGLNHKTAPIEIRETVAFTQNRLFDALTFLKKYEPIKENLILSTCNRVEIYAVTNGLQSGSKAIHRFLCEFHRINQDRLQKHFYFFNDINAIRHLFKVVSSLDSMIVGETQIFGQVKQAYLSARNCRAIGKVFRGLFEEAIKVGKKIRTQTQIGKGAVSISSASVELARKIFENLKDIKILIIGTGKIGELAVKNLSSRGASAVLVANRTFERAQNLARSFGGVAVKFENFFEYLKEVDIVISSTSAPHFVITKGDLSRLMRQRNQRPIFLIDLGLPRNIDPEAGRLDNIYLYNIDDLARVRDANLEERMRQAKRAEEIIEKSIESTIKKLNLINPDF